jgi:hypothetical protein
MISNQKAPHLMQTSIAAQLLKMGEGAQHKSRGTGTPACALL